MRNTPICTPTGALPDLVPNLMLPEEHAWHHWLTLVLLHFMYLDQPPIYLFPYSTLLPSPSPSPPIIPALPVLFAHQHSPKLLDMLLNL